MKKIAFFDAKQYDKIHFNKYTDKYEIEYYESRLGSATAALAQDSDAVCAFVNDKIDAETIEKLKNYGVGIIALRNTGYSNVDFDAAYGNIHVVRVPAYSPYAVAEHAIALLQTLNRKTHRAYIRTRDFNFNLNGLMGMDLHRKTVGVVGTGAIGRIFIDICKGFGMKVLAYDPYPIKEPAFEYADIDTLIRESDVISLHCPLTDKSYHLFDEKAFAGMKKGAVIINTSRGALIDSKALLDALNSGKLGGAALDVYEEEADLFFEDFSGTIINDDTLALLLSRPNVIITSHQAFLTEEALSKIAEITVSNLDAYFDGKPLINEVCYQCGGKADKEHCRKTVEGRCF